MESSGNYPALAGLEELVHKHRRLVAGELRVIRERKQLEYDIEAHLKNAGVEVVSCRISLGAFEVRRQVTRDGRHYASVAPIQQ